MKIIIKEQNTTPLEYNFLRKQVGWTEYDLQSIAEGMKNTIFCLCIYDGSKIIGMGRVIGDGKLCFYIQDIIVIPEYQKNKIGTQIMNRIMEFIKTRAVNNTIVGLMSALGKEQFYESFGFAKRPNESFGCGMNMFIKR